MHLENFALPAEKYEKYICCMYIKFAAATASAATLPERKTLKISRLQEFPLTNSLLDSDRATTTTPSSEERSKVVEEKLLDSTGVYLLYLYMQLWKTRLAVY